MPILAKPESMARPRPATSDRVQSWFKCRHPDAMGEPPPQLSIGILLTPTETLVRRKRNPAGILLANTLLITGSTGLTPEKNACAMKSCQWQRVANCVTH